jgi:hypothetical protein
VFILHFPSIISIGGLPMVYKEKLFSLFDTLDEHDQKAAYEFIKSLAHHQGKNLENEEVIQLFGKNFFVVPD